MDGDRFFVSEAVLVTLKTEKKYLLFVKHRDKSFGTINACSCPSIPQSPQRIYRTKMYSTKRSLSASISTTRPTFSPRFSRKLY
jgi:hypothetical protein